MDNFTYASIVPLIGGETIAMENVFGKRPEHIMSYTGFQANEEHLLNHYNNEVPYHILDEGNPKLIRTRETIEELFEKCLMI